MGKRKKRQKNGSAKPNPATTKQVSSIERGGSKGGVAAPTKGGRFWGNWLTLLATIGIGVFLFTYRFEGDGLTGAERIYYRLFRTVQQVTAGCDKPPASEVEAYFGDKAGSVPVAPDFDVDEGEICGNGRKYYCTSLPPDKPIPFGWEKPPRVGADPDYQGPSPLAPFKESPHAMPSSKAVLARSPIKDRGEADFVRYLKLVAPAKIGTVGVVSEQPIDDELAPLLGRTVQLRRSTFETSHEPAVARMLAEKGISFVLYDRLFPAVAPWMEEHMDEVGVRMRDGVSLHEFAPVIMGSRYALYRVVTPFEIPRYQKRRLTTWLRGLLAGDQEASAPALERPLEAVGHSSHRVVVSLRKRAEKGMLGRKVIQRLGQGPTIVAAAAQAVSQIKNDWSVARRNVKRDLGVSLSGLSSEIGQMEIEVDVLYHQCYLADRHPSSLLWYLELGLEGLMLESADGSGKPTWLEPSFAVQREVTSEVRFLERLLKRAGLDVFLREAKNRKLRKRGQKVLNVGAFLQDTTYLYKRFRTVNWVERPRTAGGDIVEIYRGVPLVQMDDVSYGALLRSLKLGAGWLMNNQTPDGQFRYKLEPLKKEGNRWTAGGNIVRHALNPYTLLMVNKLEQRDDYVESAKRGIDFTLKFLRRDGDRCCICHRDPPARYYNAKLNAVAVTILSILKLGQVADIGEYADELKCMAEEMLYMQDKNGHFRQYDVPENHPYYGAESTIHAGEFIFVLARLYSYYKDERFKEACDKAIAYYMEQWNKWVKERTPEGIYDEEHRVNLIGIVPWLVTAMEDLHRFTGDEHYARLGLKAQDWIDNEFFWWPRRAQYPDYVGASFKVHKELPAVNSCQYAEGASAALAIAKRVGRDVERRRQVVVYAMRFCLQVQYEGVDSTFFLPDPDGAMGGYKYTLGHLRVRNDYNYHAMAAIAQAAEYLDSADYPDQAPLDIPATLREIKGRYDPSVNEKETP